MRVSSEVQAKELYDYARSYLVGGVSSSARVNKAIGRPFYISRGRGAYVYDLEGREYVDMCTSHGASLLGHNHPAINAAVMKALELGTICSYETSYQSELAHMITQTIPCAELVRFTGSGTEATMHTIRLAREYTGKEKVIKFEGHFHGYHDYIHYNSWPPAKALIRNSRAPYSESGGVPKAMPQYVIVLPFNDLPALEEAVKAHKDEVAAIICEPINYNAGCVLPRPGYMEAVRQLTRDNGILLIFDEVLSAFRTGPSCGQGYLGITPDLCTLGKAVGGGLPLSVLAGKREIMEHFRPIGNAEHSGTYNGHLTAILAGIAFFKEVTSPGFYDHLYALGDRLYRGLDQIFRRAGLKVRVQGLGARFGLHFGIEEEVWDYETAVRGDKRLFLKFVAAAIEQGVYFHDGAHHGFSAAHTLADIDRTLERVEAGVKTLV